MVLKKQDLINILVEEYGYEKEDLKFDVDGNPYTNAKLKRIIETEKRDAEQIELELNRPQAPTSKIKDTDKVYIMNGRSGVVVYHSDKTNKTWKLNKFGEIDTMEYHEIISMNNRYSSYLRDGWFIVLDKTVQDELKLTEMYKNILTPERVDEVFAMDVNEIADFLDKLPEGQINTFIDLAREKIENGTLDSRKIIEFIQNKFGFYFDDNAPINDLVLSSELSGSAKIIVIPRVY